MPRSSKRWSHRAVATAHDVPEDVVRRIYAAVQTAKRQGLYGGHTADLIERAVGRRLVGKEYTVAALAKEHLGHAPPGGYGGPEPTGAAKAPPRATFDDPKIQKAQRLVTAANRAIADVRAARENRRGAVDDDLDRVLLHKAADDLDVAADLYEEAGAAIRAGTLHQRAVLARRGALALLASYD